MQFSANLSTLERRDQFKWNKFSSHFYNIYEYIFNMIISKSACVKKTKPHVLKRCNQSEETNFKRNGISVNKLKT